MVRKSVQILRQRETAGMYNESALSTVVIFQFESDCLAYVHLSTYFISPTCSTTLEPERRLSSILSL